MAGVGYFDFRDAKAGPETGSPRDLSRGVAPRRRKLVAPGHCLPVPFVRRSPSPKAVGAGLSDEGCFWR